MNLIAHRGFWTAPQERNTTAAFRRSWEQGFGIETDIRDLAGQLVISHDPPQGSPLTLAAFLEDYKREGRGTPLALNIKSDGLFTWLAAALSDFRVSNYFVFDMSVPDSLGYFKEGIRVYTRQSEYEPDPAFGDKAAGIWLDMFLSEWPSADHIQQHLAANRPVCLVSPELHKREHLKFWTWLRSTDLHRHESLALCTDHPAQAREFFNGSH